MDEDTRLRIEADLASVMPFSEIARRHGVSNVDVALVHNRMRPQPVAWPEAIPAAAWEEVAAALRRDDLARIASGDADELLRTVYELDAAETRRRRAEHRKTWLEMTFDPVPDDVERAVVELWSTGGTSTAMAAEILDVATSELHDLAARLGIPINRSDA